MPAMNALRLLATVLGIVGGLIELYFAVNAAFAATMSATKGASILFVALAIVASAIAMNFVQDISIPAAFMLVSTAIFHNFVEVKLYEFIPFIIIAIAGVAAFIVDAQIRARKTT
jgi:hypothetical protein